MTCDTAGWAPPIVWTTLAIYYGGAAQFIAGMISFAKNDVFDATAFSTYGSFWLARAIFCLLYAYPGAQVCSWYALPTSPEGTNLGAPSVRPWQACVALGLPGRPGTQRLWCAVLWLMDCSHGVPLVQPSMSSQVGPLFAFGHSTSATALAQLCLGEA